MYRTMAELIRAAGELPPHLQQEARELRRRGDLRGCVRVVEAWHRTQAPQAPVQAAGAGQGTTPRPPPSPAALAGLPRATVSNSPAPCGRVSVLGACHGSAGGATGAPGATGRRARVISENDPAPTTCPIGAHPHHPPTWPGAAPPGAQDGPGDLGPGARGTAQPASVPGPAARSAIRTTTPDIRPACGATRNTLRNALRA